LRSSSAPHFASAASRAFSASSRRAASAACSAFSASARRAFSRGLPCGRRGETGFLLVGHACGFSFCLTSLIFERFSLHLELGLLSRCFVCRALTPCFEGRFLPRAFGRLAVRLGLVRQERQPA